MSDGHADDARRRHPGTPCGDRRPDEQTGLRAAGGGREDDGLRQESTSRGLFDRLERTEDLAPCPGRIGAADGDQMDSSAIGASVRGDALDERLALGATIRLGLVHRRAEQLDELQVRRVRDAWPTDHDLDAETDPRARGGGEPAVVRPAPPGRDDRVGPGDGGCAEQELQVAQLVAREGERPQVLALDPQLCPATQRLGEPGERLQRRRAVEQRDSRQLRQLLGRHAGGQNHARIVAVGVRGEDAGTIA